MDENSIGYIKPTIITIKNPLKLLSGKILSQYDLIYETYGSLNKDGSNAVLYVMPYQVIIMWQATMKGKKSLDGGTI